MYNCPYMSHMCEFSTQNNDFYRQPQRPEAPFSYIRLLHAVPDAPAVDAYVNDRLVARNLAYRNFTSYIKLPIGSYDIKLFPAGRKTSPVISTKLVVPRQSIFTVAVIGTLKDISIYPILEPQVAKMPGNAFVRFIHLSPNTPNVDITLPTGQKLFSDVKYKDITPYIPVKPSTLTIEARLAGTDNVILIVPNIRLLPNRFYSIYAIGLLNGKPPLQVLIPLDGNTYLKF